MSKHKSVVQCVRKTKEEAEKDARDWQHEFWNTVWIYKPATYLGKGNYRVTPFRRAG